MPHSRDGTQPVTNMGRQKARPLALEWDSSVMLFTLQSSPWGQAKSRFQLKQQSSLALSSALSCLQIHSLAVPPESTLSVSHLHENPHCKLCF